MKWNGGFVVNKTKVYCVASAVAVCVASNPSMDVLAKHLQPVKLEEKAQQTISAEDYIKYYLSTKEIVKDLNNKDIEKYTLARGLLYTGHKGQDPKPKDNPL